MSKKLLLFLGLARKAGKLILGHDAVLNFILKNKGSLVLVSSDVSERSFKKIKEVCDLNKIEIINLEVNMDDILKNLGKRAGIMAVINSNFISKIKNLLNENNLKGENCANDLS